MNDIDSIDRGMDASEIAAELAAIQPRLYGFILKRLADREQTLEVLQRTNLVICEKSHEFQRGSSFIAWVFTIARFQVMAWRKTANRERLVFTDSVSELLDRVPDVELLSVDDRIAQLRDCLKRLRDVDRELIQRKYRDGETIQSIANSLRKSVDAISMRLMRIRRQLAECVSHSLNESDERLGDVL